MNHKNFAQSTLAAAITGTVGTSITVASSATFPAAPFIISIDTEAMLVTVVAGTTWTVTRGYEGSTAATHFNAAIIYHDISAGEADRATPDAFNVKNYGAYGDNTHDDTAAINAAMAAIGAAEGILYFPIGTYLTTGILLNGKALTIRGDGNGSIIKGKSGITGAVIDFTDYISSYVTTARCFSNFQIIGDGAAGSGHYGMYFAGASPVQGISFRNIAISRTGDAGIYLYNVNLCEFTEIFIRDYNGTPLLLLNGWANSNVFTNCGFGTEAVKGNAVGAVILQTDGTFYPEHNLFVSCWSEGLRLPEGSSIIYDASRINSFDNFTAWDTLTVDASNNPITTTTDTCAIRLAAAGGHGSNEVRGIIPGKRTVYDFKWGVIISQNGNLVIGTKDGAYNPLNNVRIDSGYGYNVIQLSGGMPPCETFVGIIDNSGVTTNTLVDPANKQAIVVGPIGSRYSEGTWTPALISFTIVGSAPAVEGIWKRIGNLVFVECKIYVGTGGNTSVACTVLVSCISGLTINPTMAAPLIITDDNAENLGIGVIAPAGNLYPPTFAAKTVPIYITVTYYV